MSKTETTARQKALVITLGSVALALIITLGLVLREYGPGNMGNGFLTGAAAAILVASAMGWRALRHPDSATAFERAYTQTGDERDSQIFTRSLAVLGLLSIPMAGLAAVLVGLGVPHLPVLAVLVFGLIAIFAVAFFVVSRRH